MKLPDDAGIIGDVPVPEAAHSAAQLLGEYVIDTCGVRHVDAHLENLLDIYTLVSSQGQHLSDGTYCP